MKLQEFQEPYRDQFELALFFNWLSFKFPDTQWCMLKRHIDHYAFTDEKGTIRCVNLSELHKWSDDKTYNVEYLDDLPF